MFNQDNVFNTNCPPSRTIYVTDYKLEFADQIPGRVVRGVIQHLYDRCIGDFKFLPNCCNKKHPVFCRAVVSVNEDGVFSEVYGYNAVYECGEVGPHAEEACFSGIKSKLPSVVVCTRAPCLGCAKHIVEAIPAGSYLLCPDPEEDSKWHRSQKEGETLLRERGIFLPKIKDCYWAGLN